MYVTFDIEADGLLRDATKVWCISLKIDEQEAKLHNPEDGVRSLADLLDTDAVFIGHNISGYDIPLLYRLYGLDIPLERCIDTLLLSRMAEPEEFQHSLESWGEFLGDAKILHEDWSKYSDEMGRRCNKDCEITYKVFRQLTSKPVKIPRESLVMEMQFNYIMAMQEVRGWSFDIEAAKGLMYNLDSQIQELATSILSKVPRRIIPNRSVKKSRTVAGKISKPGYELLNKHIETKGYDIPDIREEDLGDCFCTFSTEDMNLNSVKQVKDYLLSIGWRPTEFNYKKEGKRIIKDDNGRPIVSSPKLSNLESLTDGVGLEISKRILLSHRRNQIRGWIERVRDDNRLEAGGVSCSTNTARVAHRNIVNVPKADDAIFLGRAMRALFKAGDGYVLVGADLDQLEARVAANYTTPYDGGEYADTLLKGNPHEDVAKKLGCTKAVAKCINYALQYGAQVPKLAAILGCSESRAGFLWNEWWSLRSSLNSLREDILRSIESRGYDRKGRLDSNAYVKTIDGRPIFIRSWHSALNALIQSTGSILFKEIVCKYCDLATANGLTPGLVGNFHDEVIVECRPGDVDIVRNMLTSACEYVNIKYKLKVPLTLDARVGNTWGEIH